MLITFSAKKCLFTQKIGVHQANLGSKQKTAGKNSKSWKQIEKDWTDTSKTEQIEQDLKYRTNRQDKTYRTDLTNLVIIYEDANCRNVYNSGRVKMFQRTDLEWVWDKCD